MKKPVLIIMIIGMMAFATSAVAIICSPPLCGDCNHDGNVNIQDVTCMINFYYCYEKGLDYCEELGEWVCENNIDCDGNSAFQYEDITYLINYLYRGGPAPVCPF